MSAETIKFRQENRRKKRLREITTHIVLLVIVFVYSYMGAKLFQSIEEKHEEKAKGSLIKSKHDFLDQLKLGLGSAKLDQKNWTRMADKLLNYYVEDLAVAVSHGVDITDVTQHEYESESKWDFWGSLFYAGTVYTTIGYGNFAPVTPEGKVATVIYGTIGIPLCLILLADLGNLIAKLIKYGVKRVKKQWYTSSSSKKNLRELWPPQDEIDTMSGKSSLVVLCIVCLLYFTLGAVMYRTWEDDWTYLDAVYFIFVSTSTIGFGDVLPNHPKKFILTSLYIFFGLSLLSSGFTILQDLLENKISEKKADIDTVLGIQKSEQEPVDVPKVNKEQLTPITEEEITNSNRVNAEKQETTPASSESNIQEAISELIAVEESIEQQSVNNNLSSAPPKFQIPIEELSSTAHREHYSPEPRIMDNNSRVSETRFVSLDDGVLSVEATIILDQ